MSGIAAPVVAPVRVESRGAPGRLQRCGGRTCPPGTCDHDALPLRRLAASDRPETSGARSAAALADVPRVLGAGGRPLPEAAREAFGARLGHDLRAVRIHTDAAAARSAASVGAVAYTVGSHIVFGAGAWSPDSADGRTTIAHELVHAIQQDALGGSAPVGARSRVESIVPADDASEREASRLADGWRSSPASVPGNTPPAAGLRVGHARASGTIQRQGATTSGPSCKLEVCWAPIKAYHLSAAAQVHGVINVDGGAGSHHLEVDPSQHMPKGIWHSHVVDDTGSKSAPACQTLPATCAEVAKIESAAKRYETRDVIYDPLTVTGPNSNSFVEWTLGDAGISTSLVSVPFGATGWSYFQRNPPQRTDPPHVARTDPGKTPAPPPKPTGGGSCTKAYTRQTTGAGYVDLVRAAETKLTAAGIGKAEDHVKILRGLYYGTPWSRDFGKEQSLSRVAGFQTYTLSGTSYPRDPVSILDCGLYDALQRTQDVTAHGVTLDVGHLLIGLDAREATVAGMPTPSVPFPGFGGSGLEIVTWLGDLGGGAGSLARDRATGSASAPVSAKFSGVDYGGSSNLEGDVAAFITASGGKTTVVAPVVPAGKGVADALEAYLAPSTAGGSGDWKARATTFLKMYGGTFSSSGALTNGPALITAFADQIESFACAYVTQRYFSTVSEATFLAITDHVRSSSKEVAETFVHALEDAATGGGRIEAKRYPSALPAAPGACLTVTAPIRAKQKARQLVQQAEELWKAL